MWIYNGQVIKSPKEIKVGTTVYPRQVFKDKELLKSLGIKLYREVGVDSKYYWQGQKTLTETEGEVIATYEAIPKLLDDRLEVNEDGTPMVDEEGNQVITKGLKSALKEKVSTKYKAMMVRPEVDTGLGFKVDGGYQDLQNFQIGKELGVLVVKDVDGVMHDITIDQYDDILTAIKTTGLELFNQKWQKEAEVDAISSIEELIEFEANL